MGLNISKESTLRLSTITGAVLADAGLILIMLDNTLAGVLSLFLAALFIGLAAAILRK
jgi:hypothetical protein